MAAYYNEIDLYAAQWLRNLIAAGHIAPGDVDTRSIEDVRPDDIRGYAQCHFFAGIGVWSHSLRRAGWSDDTPIWTGSCPCQPFSAAGKGSGFADERHLWPAFFHLVRECRPERVLGEQVASKDGLAWLDLVQTDMEAENYAFAAVDTCSAGHGAPHIRQRLRFAAYDLRLATGGVQHSESDGRQERRAESGGRGTAGGCGAGGMADADGWNPGAERQQYGGKHRQQSQDGESVGLADSHDVGPQGRRGVPECSGERSAREVGLVSGMADAERNGRHGSRHSRTGRWNESADGGAVGLRPGPTNGFWRDADWLLCTDGRWRPVEPGTFPLAHGVANRVGKLRAYGNAVDAQATTEFVSALMEMAL